MEAFVSLAVAFIGVLIYALSANPKLVEIGRIMFFCGLLAFLIHFGAGEVRMLH